MKTLQNWKVFPWIVDTIDYILKLIYIRDYMDQQMGLAIFIKTCDSEKEIK